MPMKALVAAAVAVFLLSAAPDAANAHSRLKSSVPASGAVLAEAPAEAVVVFDEEARVTSLRLFDANGGAIALTADPVKAPGTASVALPPLPDGAYELEWRAISVDGHPIRGRVRFEVGAAR